MDPRKRVSHQMISYIQILFSNLQNSFSDSTIFNLSQISGLIISSWGIFVMELLSKRDPSGSDVQKCDKTSMLENSQKWRKDGKMHDDRKLLKPSVQHQLVDSQG